MNPLFQSFQQNQNGNSFNLMAALQNIARQIPHGMTPEELVRQKIQNGEMTMQQFQQFSAIADQLTGRNNK